MSRGGSRAAGAVIAAMTVTAVVSVSMLPLAQATATVTTNRFGGSDRYATAAILAERAFPNGVQGVFLARGEDFPGGAKGFPDALAANYGAGHYNVPVLLTAADNVPAATLDALKTMKVKDVVILGGTSAVSAATEQAVDGMGISTVRLAGADRQATATAIASYGIANLGFSDKLVDLARGDDYPDALAAGMEAVKAGPVPIVLTVSPTDLGTDTPAWLRRFDGTLAEVDALGLQSAVSDTVLAQAAQDATCTPAPLPTTTTTAGGIGVLTTLLGALPTTTSTTATTAPPATIAGQCNAPVVASTTSTSGPASTTTTTAMTTVPILSTLPTI